jgi:RNA polymerase sigma factor (sigma-70 family)
MAASQVGAGRGMEISAGRVTQMLVRWQRRSVNDVSLEDAYSEYADDLVRYAAVLVPRSAAADVVADTFADLLRRRDGAWSSARDVKKFLFGAVANRARMYHRQNVRRRQREQHLVTARSSDLDGVVVDSREGLIEAFEELSVQQRAVTYLTYWQDLSVSEVAETLGVGDGTVRRQLARARSRLRGALS